MPHAVERRRAARHRLAAVAYCRIGSTEGVVWDLSAAGLGMLIRFPLEVNRPAAVELSNHATSVFIVADVVRVRRMDAGGFFVGLRFDTPLTRQELESFVTPPAEA